MKFAFALLAIVGCAYASSSSSSFTRKGSVLDSLSLLDSESSLFGSSSADTCKQVIQGFADDVREWVNRPDNLPSTCAGFKHMCGACSSCKTFTDGTTISNLHKNCLCYSSTPLAAATLSHKDDCVIFIDDANPNAFTINGDDGDDCFIIGGGAALVADTGVVQGGNGDDVFIVLPVPSNASHETWKAINGSKGSDCFALAQQGTMNATAHGNDGSDIFFVDPNFRPALVPNFLVLEGDGGSDALVHLATGRNNVVFRGGRDSDLAYAGSHAVAEGFYGGSGDDTIIEASHALIRVLEGGDDDDKILVRGVVDRVNGDLGRDRILIDTSADAFIVNGDMIEPTFLPAMPVDASGYDDRIVVKGVAHFVLGGFGNDAIYLTDEARVESVDGDFENPDDWLLTQRNGIVGSADVIHLKDRAYASYIRGGLGSDEIRIGSHAVAYIVHGGYFNNDGMYVVNASDSSDIISVSGYAYAVYGDNGSDYIHIESSGVVQEVYGDDRAANGVGMNHIKVDGRVLRNLTAGPNDDYISVGEEGTVHLVYALGGNDEISVHGSAFRVLAGAGNDLIEVDGSVNRIEAEAGNDTIVVHDSASVRGRIYPGADVDTCQFSDTIMENLQTLADRCEFVGVRSSTSSSDSSPSSLSSSSSSSSIPSAPSVSSSIDTSST